MTGRRQWLSGHIHFHYASVPYGNRGWSFKRCLLHQSEVPVAFDLEGVDGEGG